MSSKSIKYERVVTAKDLQPICEAVNNFLASIDDNCATIAFDKIRKAEISIKQHSDGYKFKAKLTPVEPCVTECLPTQAEDEETEDDADVDEDDDESDSDDDSSCDSKDSKPLYKTLKKRMDKDFDIIKKHVKGAEFPPADTVKRFMEDSDKMCRFQDKGEKYYKTYLTECNAFQKSFDEEDIDALEAHLNKIKNLKKSCHKMYK